VIDHVSGLAEHEFMLNWLLDNNFKQPNKVENILHLHNKTQVLSAQFGLLGDSTSIDILSGDESSMRGWVSHYYGHKEPALSIQLTRQSNQAVFWSFFGNQDNQITQTGEALSLQVKDLFINLDTATVTITKSGKTDEMIASLSID
jgi:hypothetical protein